MGVSCSVGAPGLGVFFRGDRADAGNNQDGCCGYNIGRISGFPISDVGGKKYLFSRWVTVPARLILNLIRTLPELLLAALFVAIFGIGPIPGIFALMLFSLGIITKLFYESIESIDPGPMEAMTAVGANKIKWIVFGVVPQVMSSFISFYLYAFEINIRAAAVLGLVGAGESDYIMKKHLDFFNMGKHHPSLYIH